MYPRNSANVPLEVHVPKIGKEISRFWAELLDFLEYFPQNERVVFVENLIAR